MAKVHPGRFTAEIDGDVVVFVIGMRINRLWKVHKWVPVMSAMPKMLAELFRHPDKGLLAARTMVSGKTINVIQYWRSFDHLEHFARAADDPHLAAWRRFNQRVGASKDVGVYHETYQVTAGQHESIYVNMPVLGLAKAGTHAPVARRGETARERIGEPAASPAA